MQAIHFAAIGGYEHIIEKLVKEFGVSPTVEVYIYVCTVTSIYQY